MLDQPRDPDASVRIAVSHADVVGLGAANPGPFTLSGTNSWVVGRSPAWLIDPGPALDRHVSALADELRRRGGLGGVALTHDHPDHSEAVAAVRRLFPDAPVAGAGDRAEVKLGEGESFGPLEALPTPGHSPDHLAFVFAKVAFTGDAVLGRGSVFVTPYPGSLAAYLAGLERLRSRRLVLLCPGHGPPVDDPERKLEEYLSHRREREQRLVRALAEGARTVDQMLDEAWSDAPAQLRPAAAWTLAAHLDKLESEGRLPEGVERPELRS